MYESFISRTFELRIDAHMALSKYLLISFSILGTGTGTLARITTSHGKKSSLVKSDSTK